MIPLWIFYTLLIELFVVSYLDMTTKRIKNIWAIVNLCFFLLFLFIYQDFYPLELKTFSYSLSFLFVGFVLFLMRIMGAGDTKFLFSFFLVTPENMHFDIYVKLLIFTGICACIFLIFNILKNMKKIYLSLLTRDLVGLKNCFGTKFAFAPVILITWIWIGIEGGYFGL